MPNISVKDVPAAWAGALRQCAARNPCSLQGELMGWIQSAVEPESGAGADLTPGNGSQAQFVGDQASAHAAARWSVLTDLATRFFGKAGKQSSQWWQGSKQNMPMDRYRGRAQALS